MAPQGQPAFILYVQIFGDLVTFNPHIHALAADLAERMLGWRHSGFSVHNRIRSKAADAEGRQRPARYMIRCPFSLEKMRYDRGSGMVIYRSKMPVSSNASSNT